MAARGNNQYVTRGPAAHLPPAMPSGALPELIGQLQQASSSAVQMAAQVSAQLDALGASPTRVLPLQVDVADGQLSIPAGRAARPYFGHMLSFLPSRGSLPGGPAQTTTTFLLYYMCGLGVNFPWYARKNKKQQPGPGLRGPGQICYLVRLRGLPAGAEQQAARWRQRPGLPARGLPQEEAMKRLANPGRRAGLVTGPG
jgi:hypothetical protein